MLLNLEFVSISQCSFYVHFVDSMIHWVWCQFLIGFCSLLHDKCYYLRYNSFKLFYWVMAVLQLVMVAAFIFILYIIADQVLTVEFIRNLGAFNLMTTGIAAQRAVRNQVLSTTALAYNNYTINNLERSSSDFAAAKNQESWEWNLKELERVDEWNNYFCSVWMGYQSTVRGIVVSKTCVFV